MYILFNHKCLFCTSSAIRIYGFTLENHTWLVLRLCTLGSKSRVGRKTQSHFLL